MIALLISAVAGTAALSYTGSPAFAHEEHEEFITNAEFIKGHLQQAIANKQAGEMSLAVAHSGHPIEEVFTLMKGPLEDVSEERAMDLEDALEALQDAVQTDTNEAFAQKVEDINGMLDEAIQLYAGEEADETATRVAVIKGLIETAGVEYSEAVADGEIIEMIEYQDASAFIDRANVTFVGIRADLPEHEADEIAEFFDQLLDAIAANADPANVQTLLDGIVHELEEVYPTEEGDEQYDGQAYIDTIAELLDQAVVTYQQGDADGAKALAIEAYIDNYEFIEGDIEEDDAELMEKIENAIRVELVEMIEQASPASEVAAQVEEIKADLETARAYVESAALVSKGDSWSEINTLLGEVEKLTGKNETATQSAAEKLAEAKAEYEAVFAHEAEEHDPETAQTIEGAFAAIGDAVGSGSVLEVTLNKQAVDKLIYKIAFIKIEEELLERQVEEAAEWFTVMSKKFNYAQNPSDASRAMVELEADPSKVDELSPVILQDLRSLFLLKVKEEITEALETQGKQPPDNANAQKFAVEGIYYYRTIQPDVRQTLGEEQEAILFGELEEFYQSAKASNLVAMQEEADEINTLLLTYEGKETTGLAAELSAMIDLLQLVNVEYIDAVSNGQIINQEEYDETLLFLTRATEKFEAIKAELSVIRPEETEEIEEDLATISETVNAKGPTQVVSDTVQHAQSELNAILAATGGSGEGLDGWGYIDKIHELLDESVAAYKAGSYEDARNIAREAYLENYEFIEEDIAADDRELMEEIEIDMRVELVEMIDQRAPAAEVEAHVDLIKTNLETARAVVTPEFPVVLAVITAVMAAGIAMAGLKGYGLNRGN